MKINELETHSDYILTIGGKAISKYKDAFEANQMRQLLLKKYPDKDIQIKKEVCKMTDVYEGSDSTQASKPKGKIAAIHPDFDGPIPSLSTVPELAGAYYGMYRFGVHMAGSPANAPHEHGPTANHMVTAAYTDAEADIINHSAKSMKMKVKAVTSKGSKEAPGTNVKSTVATPKKNKYGI